MRLIRNTTKDGRCKYALVRLDKIRNLPVGTEMEKCITRALDDLAAFGVLEYGEKGSEEEFFAIKLKDMFAANALWAYEKQVESEVDRTLAPSWMEYQNDIIELAQRAESHPSRKRPD
jgi:hypothetical protein